MGEHDQIAAGCEAWQHLHQHGRRWADWLHVARALFRFTLRSRHRRRGWSWPLSAIGDTVGVAN
jgi:hypothetical protein